MVEYLSMKTEQYPQSNEQISRETNDGSNQSLFPKNLDLPDLSPLEKDQSFGRSERLEFPIDKEGEVYTCEMDILRSKDYDPKDRDRLLSFARPLGVEIQVEDPGTEKRVLAISFALEIGPQREISHEEGSEVAFRNIWNCTYRYVNEDCRRKGWGETGMRLMIEFIERVEQEHTEFKADLVKMDTSLSSVARLIVDQIWLQEHGLSALKKTHGIDLHFIPHSNEQERAIKLLNGTLEDIHDEEYTTDDVMFVRELK